MKKWLKLGQVYSNENKNLHPKLISHAANPLPILIENDLYRVFYSGRDTMNRSSVGAIDFNIKNLNVVNEYREPFFEFGSEKSYFSHGVSIGNYYEVNGKKYILFMGWKVAPNEHWRGEIGRLVLNPDYSLSLDGHEEKPFISRNHIDNISLSYPWVLSYEKNKYHMWYGSTISWKIANGEMLHVLNYASSLDGDNWNLKGLSVPYIIGEFQAFSRPTVVKNSQLGFKMWFSYRGNLSQTYRIGNAISNDGINWEINLKNKDIDVSDTGWDSEMIEYPYVFEHKNKLYMLYNGNGFGKTGFGLAVYD